MGVGAGKRQRALASEVVQCRNAKIYMYVHGPDHRISH
jgi:hypothetical protein